MFVPGFLVRLEGENVTFPSASCSCGSLFLSAHLSAGVKLLGRLQACFNSETDNGFILVERLMPLWIPTAALMYCNRAVTAMGSCRHPRK